MSARATGIGLALLLMAAAPGRARAQAVCSAPHTSGFSGGPLGVAGEPGTGWIQLSAFHQTSSAVFGPNGDRRPLLADAVARTTSLYATASIGVVGGVDAWVQLPVHHLAFEDQTGRRARTGVGDIRAAVRIAAPSIGIPLPVALRGGVKLPGTRFPVDATVIPLTEGQRDWELSLEHGRSLIQRPFVPPDLHVLVWAGYRWRELNARIDRKPGDEVFAHLGLSGLLDPVVWRLDVDALWGRPPVQQGFRLPGSSRRLWQITPSIDFDAGPGMLGVAARLSVAGRNLPSGPSYSLSYRWAFP